MRGNDASSAWRDRLAIHVLFVVAALELGLREAYHRFATEIGKLVALMLWWILVAGSCWLIARCVQGRWGGYGRRALVMVAVALVAQVVVGPMLGRVDGRWIGPAAFGLVVLAVAALLASPPTLWPRFRDAIAAGFALFVLSQPGIAYVRAQPSAWPSVSTPVPSPTGAVHGKTLLAFILLDELNAREAPAFVEMLQAEGLVALAEPVDAAGDGTGQVIPAMFTGLRFDHAKPCNRNAVCSGERVLDFSQVTASRPDIDIVGFYHPYCAIRGLRSCARLAASSGLSDIDRWRCAAWQRTGLPPGLTIDACAEVHGRLWSELRTKILDALWQTPAWIEGGMLFAHLPLPHPPGEPAGGSLESHYRSNVTEAIDIVRGVVHRARDAGLDLRLVVFSDHALRQAHWCSNYPAYRAQGCRPQASLDDRQVPLIVAGRQVPAIAALRSNAEIFSLAATWPERQGPARLSR